MATARNRSKLVGSSVNLAAGLGWLYVALRNFDRLSFLDGYHLPEYRGLHSHGGDALLPGVVGLLFLVSAAVGFISWKRNHDTQPTITTLSGSKPL